MQLSWFSFYCVGIAVLAVCTDCRVAASSSLSETLPPPPPHRRRASAFRLTKPDRTGSGGGGGEATGPTMDVECELRTVAFDMAMRHPSARKHAAMIRTSLNMTACPAHPLSTPLPDSRGSKTHIQYNESDDVGKTLYLDCEHGDDNKGRRLEGPFKTAMAAAAAAATFSPTSSSRVEIVVRGGFCWMGETLVLNEYNSYISFKASATDPSPPVFSGGALLANLKWGPATDLRSRMGMETSQTAAGVMVTNLPEGVNAAAIDSLFALPAGAADSNELDTQTRLVRARYPNGNSEEDRMPTNYDKLGGGVSSFQEWKRAGNQSTRIQGFSRNASFYPWFGHSNDLRWVLDYHAENQSSIYSPGRQFWQAGVGTAAHYNATTFSKNVGKWTNVADAVLHVIHYDWWGNWQWQLEAVDTATSTFKFGKGGWQDAHGGPVASNYFFAENVLEELDVPGEWYVDKNERKLYYWPKAAENLSEMSFAASQLSSIVSIKPSSPATSADSNFVRGVTFDGITFAHSTTTYLAEKYAVPSAGDWSVLPKAAVTLSGGVVGATLSNCSWIQVGGNGVAFDGYVHDSSILDSDFVKTGDSGVVSVGQLPAATPHDGTGFATFPTNNKVARCHFGSTGVYGKQTSALFVAVSKQIHFTDNVLYDGPRAGININDGFGGGHVLARNVIFNQLLESGDHGPINTWSRTAYLQNSTETAVRPDASSAAAATTTIQEWNMIDNNFVMVGPKMGSLYGPGLGPCSNGIPTFLCPKGGGSMFTCLDHDDGSDYYLDTRNVCVFAGMKNYLGQNKIWDSNLIAYADGAFSQNRSGMPAIWTSMNMAGNRSQLPCTEITGPCHNREVFTNNTCVSHRFPPSEYDMFNASDLALRGPRDTTMPYTANNKYYLGIPYSFAGQWTLPQAQAHGVDVGSAVFPEMTPTQLGTAARQLLGL